MNQSSGLFSPLTPTPPHPPHPHSPTCLLHDRPVCLFNLSPSPGLPTVGELRSAPSSSYNLKCEPNRYWKPRAVGQRQYRSLPLSLSLCFSFVNFSLPPSPPPRLSTQRRQIECERTALNVKSKKLRRVASGSGCGSRQPSLLFLLFLPSSLPFVPEILHVHGRYLSDRTVLNSVRR